MCGLVGAAGDTTGKVKDIFTDLLVVDSLRGKHSTGVATVRRWQAEISLAKAVGGPHNLINSKEYSDALTPVSMCLIGHNRHATMGKHTVENAHPFKFDGIVGAHNGTLEKRSIQGLHEYEKYETDSEAIFATIAERGLRKTVDELDGAWALTWFNTADKTVNMLRNSKRPLFYTYTEDRQTMFWASEDIFLEMVFDRYKKKFLDDKIYELPVDTHVSWEIPEYNKQFEVPVSTEMKAPENLWTNWYQNTGGYGGSRKSHGAPFGSNGNVHYLKPKSTGSQTTNGNRTTHGTNTNTGRFFDNKVNTKKFKPPYKTTDGKVLNKVAFKALTDQGCAFCGTSDVPWKKFIKPFYDMDNTLTFVCENCYNDETVLIILRCLI